MTGAAMTAPWYSGGSMKANIPQERTVVYAAYDRNTGIFLSKRGVCGQARIWFNTYAGAEEVLEQWLGQLPDGHVLTIVRKEVVNNYTDMMPD